MQGLFASLVCSLTHPNSLHSIVATGLEDYYTMHPVHREVAFTLLSGQDIARAQAGFVAHVLALKNKLLAVQPTRALQLIQAGM